MDVRISNYQPLTVSANPAPRTAQNVGFTQALTQAGGTQTTNPAPAVQALPEDGNQRTASANPLGPRGGLVDILV